MKRRASIILLTAAMIICLAAVFAVVTFASSESKVDAMDAIESSLASTYRVGDVVRISDDGYIGIPLEISTYYDTSKGKTKSGYNGTPVIVYVVNTNIERIGKKSDVDIIKSMLARGYVVHVLDYLNNSKATSPDLDWSTQTVRQKIKSGGYLTNTTYFASGTYYDTIVLPAGYDVSLSNIFWEADKHGADGDLEKIVENWNTDLRSKFQSTVIYWRNSLGEKKPTQNGLDGSAPQWYSDSKGANAVDASDANAKYIKVQHTKAVDITDCVGKDGTPIDLNLYMHVVYPTTSSSDPLDSVPVIALANSSEYLSNGLNTADRPQFSGFLFNGYAGVIFDYLYQPMAQSDYYGYYDGRTSQGGVTGDQMNYGLQLYDDKRINTAAIRYVRYLTLTEPETYAFDTDNIGAYGNSKGGWFSFLGEAELRNPTKVQAGMTLAQSIDARINAYTNKRTYEGHDGETRYQNGITEDYTKNGVTIDGGELQPWTTYKDKNGTVREIPSYVHWTYASCGAQFEDVTEGHSPIFAALQIRDNYSTFNQFAETARNLNIPSLYVIVDYGHTFAYGPDYYYGFETYDAMFDFANYYLKDDAVKVIYTDPADRTGKVDTTPSITIKFAGEVSESEIQKVTLVSGSHKADGTWTSVRGNTEWTFEPYALLPSSEYLLTVPADMKGSNGVPMGSAYTASFTTEDESTAKVTVTKGTRGTYFTVTAPGSAASDTKIRFRVENNAANIAELYTVSGFNSASPDSSAKGELAGSVNLFGAGYYEIDVTKYVCEAAAGSELTFLLSAKKTADNPKTVISFASSVSKASFGAYVRGSVGTAPDGTGAAKIYVSTNVRANGSAQYPLEKPFYSSSSTAMTVSQLFGSSMTASDLGRQYRVTVRYYDTASRLMTLSLNRVSKDMVHDENSIYYNLMTVPGEWQTTSFDYTVYEPTFGDFALTAKNLTMLLGGTGKDESPIYISDITITETITNIELSASDVSLVLGGRGSDYKKNGTAKAFTIGTVGYDSFKAALTAAKSGNTIVMNKNYTFTDSDDFTGWGALEKVTLDLNGYKLYANSSKPVIHASATSVAKPTTAINVINGEIHLSRASLIGYSGSSTAGNGKVFNVSLSGVDIFNTEGSTLTSVVSETSTTAGVSVGVNVSLNDVNIDFTKRANARTPVTMLSNGSDALSVSYEVSGGSIYVDNFAALTLLDTFKKTTFLKDSNGAHTTLLTAEGASVPEVAVMTESAMSTFEYESAKNHVATYSLKSSPLSTKYGLIPEAYASAESWPFVLFDENGGFLGAYNSWLGNNGSGSVLAAAKDYVVNTWNGSSYGTNPKEAFVYMRRNYTFDPAKDKYFDNLAQVQGTVNIDLGGYTLENSANVKYRDTGIIQGIFPAYSKGFSGAAGGNPIFPTTIRVTNGALRTYNGGIVQAMTWDSVGGGAIAGKDFNFIFDNVTIGFTATPGGAGLLLHRMTNTSTVAAPYNLTFNDCVIDTTTSKASHNCTIFKLNAPVSEYVQANYTVNGGKIITDGVSTITIADSTSTHGSSVVFGKGSDGKYMSYYIPESSTKTLAIGNWDATNGDVLGFVENGTGTFEDAPYKVYTLAVNPLVTDYGMISETYKSIDSYPFALFNATTGEFSKGYATLKEAVNAAKVLQENNAWDKATGKFTGTPISSVILLRKDYTTTSADFFDNYGQIKGTVTIDLGGHSLNQGTGAGGLFWQVTIKGWGGKVYPTVINVKNGNINVYNAAAIKANVWATVDMNYRPFTYNFDGVNFGFVSGATASNLLVQYSNENTNQGFSSTVPTSFYLNYNNCTFDLITNAPANGAKLFNAAGDAKAWLKTTITVTGGEIKAPKLTLAQLYSVESTYGSSVTFKKVADGEYTKLYITSGGSAPTGDVITDSGNMSYVKTSTGSSETLYTLTSLKTPYGSIPSNKASIEDYPFVVFDTDGKYYGAFKNLLGSQAGAIDNAIYTVLRDNNKWDAESGKYVAQGSNGVKTAVIYLRRDYTMTKDEYHNNLSHTQGTIIIDLGGNTIYSDSTRTKPVFDSTGKGWSGDPDGLLGMFPSSFIVRNGSFKNHSNTVLDLKCNDSVGGGAIARKPISWTFENVTFGLMSGAKTATPVMNLVDAATTSGTIPVSVTFNDCVFDLESVAPTVSTTVINANFANNKYIKGTVVVKGGKLLASSLANVVPFAYGNAHGSTLTFAKNDEGKYFEVHTPIGASAPAYTYVFKTADGDSTLTYASSEDGKDVYTLVPSVVTKYGSIPARYADAEKYPFVIFKNGSFASATAIFAKDASASALHNSKSTGSVVLLRRDFDYKEAQYNNLSQTNTITIDLGGFTIRCVQSGNNALFYAQKKTTYVTDITIINGTILTAKNPIILYSSWKGSNSSYTGGQYFNFTFSGVTLGATEGTSPSVLIASSVKNLDEPITYGTLTLNDCTIDLGDASDTTLFSFDDPANIIRVSAEINGGKIIGKDASGVTLSNVSNGSSIIWQKGSNGKYTELYLTGGKAPSELLETPEGTFGFVKTGTDGSYSVYQLTDETVSTFVPKVSISLYSDFVYNVYVPVTDRISAIKLAGEAADIEELETSVIDGEEYYRLTRRMAASEAGESFLLEVTLDNGAIGRWTLGVIKYANRVINDSESSAAEITLVKDMLSYVKAAYVYEEKNNAASVTSEINSIIGASYDSTSAPNESALEIKTEFEGLYGATIFVGDTPAFIFCPETDKNGELIYDASRYVFTQNGKILDKVIETDNSGKTYIKVYVYAYGMSKDIEYSISGTEICGVYNIRTYLEYAKTLGDTSLVSIVERLWKYSESAEKYRLFVTSKN